MKAVGYIRVSTNGQAEHSDGVVMQREDILDYARRNNYEVVDWFVDEGHSGADDRRPAFDEIIYGEVTNPPYEVVLVASSDRVSSDINVYYYFKYLLDKKDIMLVSGREDFGPNGAFASILDTFIQTMAELERQSLTKRTSSGRNLKARRGGYSGGRPPFGYKVVDSQLVINEDQVDGVKLIFNMRDNGATYKEIADKLNELGYVSNLGCKFSFGSVRTILDNRKTYQGWYKYGDNDWVKGQHEPIL